MLSSLNQHDVTAIAFDPITDRIFSIGGVPVSSNTMSQLSEYHPLNGSLIRRRAVDLSIINFIDRFNQLHVVGDYLAFTQTLNVPPSGDANILMQAIEISSARSWTVPPAAIPEMPPTILISIGAIAFMMFNAMRRRVY
jgi:hypothetical protein